MLLLFSGGVGSLLARFQYPDATAMYFDLGKKYKKELEIVTSLIPDIRVEPVNYLKRRKDVIDLVDAAVLSSNDNEIVVAGHDLSPVIRNTNPIYKRKEGFFSMFTSIGKTTVHLPYWKMSLDTVVRAYVMGDYPKKHLVKAYVCPNGVYCGECEDCFTFWLSVKKANRQCEVKTEYEFLDKDYMRCMYFKAIQGSFNMYRNKEIIKYVGEYLGEDRLFER